MLFHCGIHISISRSNSIKVFKCIGGGGVFLTAFLLVSLLFSLSSCSGGTHYVGGSGSSSSSGESEGSSSETTYTITISDSITNGTVTASKTKAEAGEEITLTVTPSGGYAPDTLTVKDAGGADVTVTANKFTMPAKNVTVSAVFKVATVTYSVTVDGAITGGTVASDKTTGISANSTVTLTATPSGTARLKSLKIDGTEQVASVTAGTREFTFAMPAKNVTVTAEFGWIGTKEPSEAKAVGDIVFSDGSATPYADGLTLTAEQKEASISVIFYEGTGLNSGDDTTTSRTLGVGLAQNQSSLVWCVSGANAHNTNITTIQCPASGTAGNLTFTGDRNGSDNLSQIGDFLGGNDDTATEASYPAFYFAKNYKSQTGSRVSGTDYESGWYLPSIAELFQIWTKMTDLNKAIALCAGTEFNSQNTTGRRPSTMPPPILTRPTSFSAMGPVTTATSPSCPPSAGVFAQCGLSTSA